MHRILLVVLSLVAVSCGGSTPTSSSELPRGECSATDLLVGTGADAVAGRLVTVNYTLWLYDPARAESKGAQLQSSVGGAPFGFTLGTGQVISGWDRGVPGMK